MHRPEQVLAETPLVKLVAFDLGSKCGFAVAHDGRLVDSGTRILAGRTRATEAERIADFAAWAADLIRGADVVGFEDVARHNGVRAAHFFGALRGALLVVARDRGVLVDRFYPQTVKRALTGNSRADKALMVYVAEQRFRVQIVSDDHADALGVLVALARLVVAERALALSGSGLTTQAREDAVRLLIGDGQGVDCEGR